MKMDQKFAASIAWLAGITLFAGCCCCGTPEPPANGVQIQVDVSGLSDAEVETLKGQLADIAGSDSNMSTVINGAATWNYTTDDEPQAFADKIDFATVKSVADRVIVLEVSSAPVADAAADGTDDGTADGAADDSADAAADSSADDGATADGEPATDDGGDADGSADGS